MDDFPIVLDNDNNITITQNNTQRSKLAQDSLQRAKNQALLNDIIVTGEIEDDKEAKNEKLADKEVPRMKEEAKLSVSEIIRKRFKSKVKINTAKTAEEVQNLIIKPAETANTDFD